MCQVLLLVRDGAGHIFGAYLSELKPPPAAAHTAHTAHNPHTASAGHAAPHAAAATAAGPHWAGTAGFYGAGESFLFAVGKLVVSSSK